MESFLVRRLEIHKCENGRELSLIEKNYAKSPQAALDMCKNMQMGKVPIMLFQHNPIEIC